MSKPRRLGRGTEAATAYQRVLELSDNAVERAFLFRRLTEVEPVVNEEIGLGT